LSSVLKSGTSWQRKRDVRYAALDRLCLLSSDGRADGSYVPRTLFIDSDGNVSDKLVGSDPQYPHSLAVDKPDELLALMKKAHGVFDIAPKESAPAASGEGRT
jgi:hypothetical protein